MRPAVHCNPSTQMPLEGIPAGAGSSRPAGEREGQGGARERVSIDLRGLAPRLKSYAAAQRRTPAAAIRRVLVQALAQAPDAESSDVRQDTNGVSLSAKTIKVTLRMSADLATCLARRARASEMSQGGYVSALLNGNRPAPMPASHDAAIQALRASTDHLQC